MSAQASKAAKRKAGLIFTANTTSVTTWLNSPPLQGETARMEVSRDMAAKMLRKVRNEDRMKSALAPWKAGE